IMHASTMPPHINFTHCDISPHIQTLFYFFYNDTATTQIYTLSLHDALPISLPPASARGARPARRVPGLPQLPARFGRAALSPDRSEEHTSELQSRRDLVCRLLLEKKKHTQNCAAVPQKNRMT